ncbi:MAG TPA: aryl-sulfate sulfotransferase [Thermoleophilaceae bacterium]
MRRRPILLAAALAALVATPAEARPAITASPTLLPKFRPGVSDYVSRCRLGHPLTIRVRGRKPQHHRLREGQAVRVRRGGRTYHVRCIPKYFPAWTTERHGTPQSEWYLVTPTLGPHGSRVVALFDRNGAPVWWMERRTKPHDAKLLPDGNLAWSTFTNGEYASHSVPYEEHRLDGRLVRRIKAVGVPTDGHDLQVLPNGDYLVMSYVPRDGVDLSQYGGPKRATVVDNEVQELSPSGRRLWRWSSKDHLDLSESSPFMKYILDGPVRTADGRKAYDIVHLNSVEPDGDSIIISTRQTDAVYKISKATGAIEWKLGGTTIPQSLGVIGDPDGANVISGQHDARLLPDGTLTLHDNRTLTGRKPRALRFSIDEAAGTATELEHLTDPGSIYSICCGSARKLPGGDWVASWGSSGLVTELTPTGRRLFALRFGGHKGADSYRAVPVLPGQLSRRALRAGMDKMAPR